MAARPLKALLQKRPKPAPRPAVLAAALYYARKKNRERRN